jgi:hypothetical protein
MESTQSADTYTQVQHARSLDLQRHRHSNDVPPEHMPHQAAMSHRAEGLIELVSSSARVDGTSCQVVSYHRPQQQHLKAALRQQSNLAVTLTVAGVLCSLE